MARGLFDLINAYNSQGQGSNGYAPFDPSMVTPAQGIGLQARGNLMSYGAGAGHTLTGNVLGTALGGLINRGLQKRAAARPESKLAGALGSAVNTALDSKTARIMQENPGISPREAIVAAAKEMFQSTAGSQQEPEFRDMIRSAAMGRLSDMGEFDPEAQKKFAEAKETSKKADRLGQDMVSVMNTPTRQVFTMTEDQARKAIASNPNLILMDTPPMSSLNDSREVLRGPNIETEAYNPATGQYDKIGSGLARDAKGSVNIRIGDDQRSDTDMSKADADFMSSFAGMQAINHAIDGIQELSTKAEAQGISGTTGTVGSIYRFLGETSSTIQAGAAMAKALVDKNGGKDAIYNEGKMTYDELINPDRYDEIFKGFQDAGLVSKRVRASMINLAYLMAITEESSARAISDNDVKLRLMTLGADISSGKGMRQILEDRRRNAFYNLKARLENDKTYSKDPFYKERLRVLGTPYKLDENMPLDPTGSAQAGGEPEVIVGPGGKMTVRNRPTK